MLHKLYISLFISIGIFLSNSAHALPESRNGKIQTLYADPSDIVFIISGTAGPCGSSLYHLPRSNTNFKEFYSLILMAFSTAKSLDVTVISCSNDRNIVSHGSVSN